MGEKLEFWQKRTLQFQNASKKSPLRFAFWLKRKRGLFKKNGKITPKNNRSKHFAFISNRHKHNTKYSILLQGEKREAQNAKVGKIDYNYLCSHDVIQNDSLAFSNQEKNKTKNMKRVDEKEKSVIVLSMLLKRLWQCRPNGCDWCCLQRKCQLLVWARSVIKILWIKNENIIQHQTKVNSFRLGEATAC